MFGTQPRKATSKAPACGRPVGADQSCAVDREADRQLLEGHVVDDLIVSALKEGRVDRAKRLQSFNRKARRKCDGVLLGDPDVEGPLGELFCENVEPGSRQAWLP